MGVGGGGVSLITTFVQVVFCPNKYSFEPFVCLDLV